MRLTFKLAALAIALIPILVAARFLLWATGDRTPLAQYLNGD